MLFQEGLFLFPSQPETVLARLEWEQEDTAVSVLRFATLNWPGRFSAVITEIWWMLSDRMGPLNSDRFLRQPALIEKVVLSCSGTVTQGQSGPSTNSWECPQYFGTYWIWHLFHYHPLPFVSGNSQNHSCVPVREWIYNNWRGVVLTIFLDSTTWVTHIRNLFSHS